MRMKFDYVTYCNDVKKDVMELKKHYPFVEMFIYPTSKPSKIELKVIAVNENYLNITGTSKQDFLGEYSREIKMVIPFTYKTIGCDVYGAKWVKKDLIRSEDYHFFSEESDGTKRICVGTPNSFAKLENVILECVKTAEIMLVGYERIHRKLTNKFDVIAYSHGEKGIKEYERDEKKYQNK